MIDRRTRETRNRQNTNFVYLYVSSSLTLCKLIEEGRVKTLRQRRQPLALVFLFPYFLPQITVFMDVLL